MSLSDRKKTYAFTCHRSFVENQLPINVFKWFSSFQTFSTVGRWQSHQRKHRDRRIYQCKKCGLKFLSLHHHQLHRCQSGKQRVRKCHLCAAKYGHWLSLANHLQKRHYRYKKKHFDRCRGKALHTGSSCKQKEEDDKKVLLKIKAGKSMTILSPSKKLSLEDKKKNGKKKSKKKRKKEGLVLSIKNGTVGRPEKRNKTKSEKGSIEPQNGLLKASLKVTGLKLRIKTLSDVSASPKQDSVCVVNYGNNTEVENETVQDNCNDQRQSECELRSESEPVPKAVNGIVIVKDKSGKFSAEQLQKKKGKKKESAFDCLKEVGVWKVMPSPRPDRGTEVLKLKLSPHKPPKFESMVDEIHSARYLDIPVKPRNDFSGEESDLLELPAYDKESNTVNDSGIEVSSSSSCNNGNSVHSVVLDENSPPYYNTEDSLLSFDSPYGDGNNKSEHSICPRCGGIIIETNSNTRSPGKCRCYLSNPNSPFQTPISPVKLSDIHKTQDVTLPPISSGESPKLDSEKGSENDNGPHKTENKIDNSENTGNTNHLPFKNYQKTDTACVSDGENSDIMILSAMGTKSPYSSPEKEYKGKLKLKLRTKSNAKTEWEATTEVTESNPDTSLVSIEQNEVRQSEKHCKKLFVDSIDSKANKGKPKSETGLSQTKKTNSDLKHSENASDVQESEKISLSTENLMSVKFGSVHAPLVIDDNNVADKQKDNEIVVIPNKLSKKKPLFKTKRKNSKTANLPSECHNQSSEAVPFSAESHELNNIQETVQTRPSAAEVQESLKKSSLKHENPDNCPDKTVENGLKNKQYLASESETFINTENSNENDMLGLTNKRPLFEKMLSVEECSDNAKKKPLFKRRKSSNRDVEITDMEDSRNIKSSVSVAKEVTKKAQTKSVAKNISNTCAQENETKEKDEPGLKVEDSKSQNLETDAQSSECKSETNKTRGERTNPLDLFQQQFLSFLSSNRTSEKGTKSLKVETNCDENVISDSESNSVPKVKESSPENTQPFKFTTNIKTEKADNESTQASIRSSDSFSWLRIFNDSSNKGESKAFVVETNDTVDDMKDLDVDLASINKKMDDKDDDTNSLDMDDMFSAENLSALKPKTTAENVSNKRRLTKEDTESNGMPYKRRQKAKRTGGKIRRIRKKVELDFVYSDDDGTADNNHIDSDPDFNPVDSGDDFVTKPAAIKRRSSRTCSRSRRLSVMSNENSDSESSLGADVDGSDGEILGPRSRKIKQHKKCYCPCCLGDQSRMSLDSKEHCKNMYKLPRGHKQFIRSTLRLLELQEKLHSLFLSLFPDCAEVINSCKTGTEEFAELIDDILSAMGEPDPQFLSFYHSLGIETKQTLMKTNYGECQVNNIGMSFTSPDSASRPSEIDLASNEEKTSERAMSETSDCSDVRPYLLPQTSSGFTTQSSSSLKFENNTLADDVQSEGNASRFKNSDPTKELPCSKEFLDSSSAYSHSLLAIATTAATMSCSNIDSRIMCTSSLPSQLSDMNVSKSSVPVSCPESNASSSCGTLQTHNSIDKTDPTHESSNCDSLPFDSGHFYQETEPNVPMVQITIDLNAAKVALCNNPKSCLDRLHSQIIKLTHFLLPDLDLKSYFYKNLDNLEFLIDLCIDANKDRDITLDQEPETNEVSTLWTDNCGMADKLILPEDENIAYSLFVTEPGTVLTDQENYFEPNNDVFQEKIKLQRESLKKDLFVIEEDVPVHTNNVSVVKVLDSIETYNRIAQQRQSPRKRNRDGRFRKRSADEKRTLFVQEKLQNTHNSTFVITQHNAPREDSVKKTSKQKHPENSKEHFLSELNLGDRPDNDNENNTEHTSCEEQQDTPVRDANEEQAAIHTLERRRSTFSEESKNIFELITSV